MRYRKLSPTGDYVFGQGQANFYINDAAGVGQLVLTRLRLLLGEWYLDLTDGTPYATEILGVGTAMLRDQAVKSRILGTAFAGTALVQSITSYSSNVIGRKFSVVADILTIYGPTTVSVTL